jgi:hypothetical protein
VFFFFVSEAGLKSPDQGSVYSFVPSRCLNEDIIADINPSEKHFRMAAKPLP